MIIERINKMDNARLNVQFTEKQNKALCEIADELGTSKSGVLKTALSLLKVALRERRSGNRISIVKDNKVIKEIIGLE